MRWTPLWMRKGNLKRLNNLPKVTQLESSITRTQLQVFAMSSRVFFNVFAGAPGNPWDLSRGLLKLKLFSQQCLPAICPFYSHSLIRVQRSLRSCVTHGITTHWMQRQIWESSNRCFSLAGHQRDLNKCKTIPLLSQAFFILEYIVINHKIC